MHPIAMASLPFSLLLLSFLSLSRLPIWCLSHRGPHSTPVNTRRIIQRNLRSTPYLIANGFNRTLWSMDTLYTVHWLWMERQWLIDGQTGESTGPSVASRRQRRKGNEKHPADQIRGDSTSTHHHPSG
ncbi:hypothetical protein BDP67DRAFT_507500 [Colletotrichum lupini]|nr:hypothetical protein BDP67DRAFT_507500 [Colletotrichum lupini]